MDDTIQHALNRSDHAAAATRGGTLRRRGLQSVIQRRSSVAFLWCLPLLLLVAGLIAYPGIYAIYLSMLNKAQTKFVGLGNFSFLMGRDTFWMVVWQSCIFAITAVIFKAIIGIITAHLVN